MSCYLHNLKDIFREAGIEVTPDNRKQIDRAIHEVVNTTYKDCSVTWKEVKKKLASNEAEKREFIKKLKAAMPGVASRRGDSRIAHTDSLIKSENDRWTPSP